MDSRYPPNFTPSQHGEPCPHEGDETSRYATLLEDFLMVAGGILSLLVGIGLVLFFFNLLVGAFS